jgi:hypothetical protein
MYSALSTIYPEKKWLPWLFDKVPQGYWEDTANQLSFLDWISQRLEVKSQEDWYKIKTSGIHGDNMSITIGYVVDIEKLGGTTLLRYYNGSLIKALQTLYPDKEWLFWKFDKVPRNFWESKANQLKFLKWVETVKNIRTLDDWYNVSGEDMIQVGK